MHIYSIATVHIFLICYNLLMMIHQIITGLGFRKPDMPDKQIDEHQKVEQNTFKKQVQS